MRSLKTRLKDMLAVPNIFPMAQDAVIIDASYLPMTTQGVLLRANSDEKTETVEFTHCTIIFELDNGIQGTLLETTRVLSEVNTDVPAEEVALSQTPERSHTRIPGETIQVIQDFKTGGYCLDVNY